MLMPEWSTWSESSNLGQQQALLMSVQKQHLGYILHNLTVYSEQVLFTDVFSFVKSTLDIYEHSY